MVAINLIALCALLPSLAMGAAHSPRSHRHRLAVVRDVHAVPRAIVPDGPNAGHNSAARHVKATNQRKRTTACRVRPTDNGPSKEESAPPAEAGTPEGDDSTDAPPPTEGEQAPETGEQPPSEQHQETQVEPEQHQETQVEPEQPPAQEHKEVTSPELSNAYADHNNNGGLLQMSGPCGDSQADNDSPNGKEWWFNCGIDGGGWNPPFISVNQVVSIPLEATGIFAPCHEHIDRITRSAHEFGLPPTLVASIALQESTCDANKWGPAGEIGLMQLRDFNCIDDAGNRVSNCHDPDFNVRRGAQFMRQLIDQYGGDFLVAMGHYNGWQKGMTKGSVYAMAPCEQPNLDYFEQLLNGWMQGKTAWQMGSERNRDICDNMHK